FHLTAAWGLILPAATPTSATTSTGNGRRRSCSAVRRGFILCSAGTELTDGGWGRRLQEPQGSTSSPVLFQGGAFLCRFARNGSHFWKSARNRGGKMARQRKPRTYAGASR